MLLYHHLLHISPRVVHKKSHACLCDDLIIAKMHLWWGKQKKRKRKHTLRYEIVETSSFVVLFSCFKTKSRPLLDGGGPINHLRFSVLTHCPGPCCGVISRRYIFHPGRVCIPGKSAVCCSLLSFFSLVRRGGVCWAIYLALLHLAFACVNLAGWLIF